MDGSLTHGPCVALPTRLHHQHVQLSDSDLKLLEQLVVLMHELHGLRAFYLLRHCYVIAWVQLWPYFIHQRCSCCDFIRAD